MKKQFLIISTFIFAMTSGILQADSNPTMSRVYGNQFTPQVDDTQAAATVGTLDTTFDTDGIDSVDEVNTGGQGAGIETLPNGDFLVVVSGTPSKVGKYNSVGTLQTYGTSGIATLDTSATPRATMLDTQSRLLVAGGAASGSAGWINRVSTDGTTVTTFTTSSAWEHVGGLAQQTSGKIIAVGFDGTNGMIARYTLAGALDTTFGASGYIVFDGTNGLTATTGLYSVVVDASDNVYVAYLDTAAAKIAKFDVDGALVTGFDTDGIVAISYLDAATATQMSMALNFIDDLVVAGEVSGSVKVTSVTSASGAGGTVADFTTSVFDSLYDIVATSDDKVILIGSETGTIDMAVMRLTSVGTLDTSFNPTSGYNLFNLSSPDTTALLNAAAIAPDGQIYATGYQVDSATTVPYVARLNNTQYVSEVAQYPNSEEVGTQDLAFGTAATQTYKGVYSPFNGIYGPVLEQKAKSVVELSTGKILIGIDGLTDSSTDSTMTLARVSSLGVIDATYGTAGFVTTTNETTSAETLNAMGVDSSDNVYVAGTAPSGATFRKYSSTGSATWDAIDATAGAQGVGMAIQGSTRALLFEDVDGSAGRISAYTLAGGILDTGFGASSSGQILTTSYTGLNMGPVYSGVVSSTGLIYVAYKNASTNNVSVAAFTADGSALQSGFATSGVYLDLFGVTTPTVSNVRIGFDKFGKLTVVAVASGTVYMAGLNGETGVIDPSFNGGSVLTFSVTAATSLNMARLTGISDGTTLLTMSDDDTDDSIMVVRVLADGTGLDTTFNTQGSQPGVLPLQIGNEVTNYNNRTATSALIQSVAGANQGNVVLASYESVTSSDSTPMVMRVYGTSGTTEVKDYPAATVVPGTFDDATDFTSQISAGFGNVVFAYPAGNAYDGHILVGIDNGTSSRVSRVAVDTMLVDGTFGTGGTYVIPGSLVGISCIAIDENDKVLVGGTDGTGWAKRLTADGAIDISFTMPSAVGSITAINGIAQQKSGRYIIAATNNDTSDYPVLVGFQDTGSVDPTFNPMLVGGAGSTEFGIFGLGTTISSPVTGAGLYSLGINSDDTIVAAYATAAGGTVYLAQVAADASGYVNAFNSGVPVNTTMDSDGSSSVRVAIDSTGKFVAATSYNTGVEQVEAVRYTTAGAVDAGWNSEAILTISNLGDTGITLTGFMETSSQQTVLTGYNATFGTIGNGRIFAVRLDSAGELDSTWNPSPTGTDTAGVLTFDSSSVINTNSAYIQVDGIVDLFGSTNATAGSSAPTLLRVYGDDYIHQVVESQVGLAAGVLDTTLPGGSTGSMLLDGSIVVGGTTVSATITGVPRKIAIYDNTTDGSLILANGSIMVGSSNGTSSFVTMMNPDLSANDNYGTTSVATIASTVIGSATYAMQTMTDMYLTGDISSNTELPILVTGNDGSGVMTGAKIAADGDTVTYIANTTGANSSGLTAGYAIRQSTNERILVAGYNDSFGAIAAFGSLAVDGVYPLDLTFGNQGTTVSYPTGTDTVLEDGGGVYLTASDSPIVDMAVDSFDRIYIAYATSTTNINVVRLLADGTDVDSAFGTQTITGTAFSLASTQIRLVLDATNSYVIVAAQDGTGTGNIVQLQRFSTTDGTPSALLSTVTIASKTLDLSDLFVDAQGYTYVVGYNETDDTSVVARITAAFALDTTAYAVDGGTPGIANVTAGSITSITAGALDPDRRTYITGTTGSNAYLARLAGDAYTTEVSEAIAVGTEGTIDPTFGSTTPTTGQYDLTTISGITTATTGKAIIALANGGNYMALDDGSNSLLVRTISTGAIDTTYGGGDGIAAATTKGVFSMMQDGSGRVLLVGTDGGAGWVQRYLNGNGGAVDTTFGTGGLIAPGISATVAVEQTLGRLVVAGTLSGGNGALFAYTSLDPDTGTTGASDVIFNWDGSTPGTYDSGIANTIYTLVADDYDRLIFAVLNDAGNAVNVYRLTPSGQLDTTFGTAGLKALDATPFGSAPDDAAQIRVALNAAGDIVVAAHLTSGDIGILTIDNGNTNTANTNGAITKTVLAISAITTPVLTALQTSADAYIYVMGTQNSAADAMWIARLETTGSAVALDSSAFNTGGGTAGIFEYAQSSPASTVHNYYGLAVRPDGRLEALGAETISAAVTPTVIRVYNAPYTTELSQTPDSKEVGTNDLTLGLTGTNGITFFGSTTGNAGSAQVARAIALQDDDNIVVAIDGNSAAGSGTSKIMINKFDNDGLLNLSFSTTGQATALTAYDNQFAQDMVTFTTVAGVNKAIIAGYVTNSTLSTTSSLLFQYDLDTPGLDSSFGGFDSNPAGVAFGDGQRINAVGLQSSGRVIASGLDQDGAGLILGYTSAGKLDTSFGVGGGYQSTGTGTTGLYSHAIDTENRIVFVYKSTNDIAVARMLADGSGLDATFTTPTPLIATVISNSDMRVALDSSNNVHVAGITASGNTIAVNIYAEAGGTATDTATITGTNLGNASAVYVISKLIVDAAGNVIIVAYDTDADNLVVVRLTSALALDTTFNGSGYVTYTVPAGVTSQVATDAIIHPDGRIIIVGSEV